MCEHVWKRHISRGRPCSMGEASRSPLLLFPHRCTFCAFPNFITFLYNFPLKPGSALISLTFQPNCQLPFYAQIQFHHSQKVPVPKEFSKKKKIWCQIPTDLNRAVMGITKQPVRKHLGQPPALGTARTLSPACSCPRSRLRSPSGLPRITSN